MILYCLIQNINDYLFDIRFCWHRLKTYEDNIEAGFDEDQDGLAGSGRCPGKRTEYELNTLLFKIIIILSYLRFSLQTNLFGCTSRIRFEYKRNVRFK